MVHWRIVASSKNSQSASLRTIRTQLLALPLQSPYASYLLLEHKSVQLMNISLLQHLFCYAYSNVQEWVAIYGNSYFEEHNYQTNRSVLLHFDDLQRLCSEFV